MTRNSKSLDWLSLDSEALVNSTFRFFAVLLTIKLITADTFYSMGTNRLIERLINSKFPYNTVVK